MNKKYIVLLFFLVSIFIYMPVNVRAASGSCSYNVDEIRSTDAKLIWECDGGEELNSWTLYNSNSNCEVGEDIDDGNGSKAGEDIVKQLKPNSYYFASFKVNNEDDGVPYVCFKTANASTNNGKVIKEVYSQESRDKCDIKITNILTDKFTVNYECNKGFLTKYNINSCSLHKTTETCIPTEENLVFGPDTAFGSSGQKDFTDLIPNSRYYFSCKINSSNVPGICFQTAAEDTYGEIIKVSKTSSSSSHNKNLNSGTSSGNNSSNSGNSFDPVHNSHDSAQDATANSFLCKEDELNKESEEYKNSISYLLDKYWAWVFVLIPIALLIFISLDFLKAFFSGKSDDMKKASSNAIKRVIAALLLMLTPVIVKAVFGIFGLTFCF